MFWILNILLDVYIDVNELIICIDNVNINIMDNISLLEKIR